MATHDQSSGNPWANLESVRFIDLDQLSPNELDAWLENLELTDPEAHAEIGQIVNRSHKRSPINI